MRDSQVVRSLVKQRGFSLVELMVSMVIGLMIILGAGQLFLNGFQSFRQVEALGDKQAALTFSADVLVKDIRRAESVGGIEGTDVGKNGQLEINFSDGSIRTYYLDKPDYEDRDVWSLYLDEGVGSPQPVVDGFRSGSAFSAEKVGAVGGLYLVTFQLVSESNDIKFYAMNRTAAVGE
tara:strand:- start:7184 stop:7717 length:534 start_codon:yes stop_codon:yes gene_type:complete